MTPKPSRLTRPTSKPRLVDGGAVSRQQAGRSQDGARVAELEGALAHERRIGVALREVGLALGTTLNLDELLELILLHITKAIEADRATLYLLDDNQKMLRSHVVQGDQLREIRLAFGEGIAGHVAQTGLPLVVNDPYADPRFQPEWDVTSGYRTRSILAAPMKNHLGRTIGVVQVLNKRSGTFSDHDAVVLTALATQAGISVENSRLFLSVTQKNRELLATQEQLEHRVRDLKLLFDLESAMGRATSLDELFTRVLSEALRTTQAHAGAFALRGETTHETSLYFLRHDHDTLERVSRDVDEHFAAAAMANDEVIVSHRASEYGRSPKLTKLLGQPCRTCIAVPLEGEEGAPIGAMVLYDKRKRGTAFTEEDRAILLLIAANASTSVRLQLSREAREREERLTTIGRLLSGVIHDLKTPLAVISGYVQLMEHADKPEVREQYAELATKQFDHIVAMQRDVLEFARGHRSLLVRRVYLVEFFDRVREELQTQLARDRVELVIELANKGTARFDEQKILRVIHNLARNAVDAMAPEGGRFTIRAAREGRGSPGARVEDLVLTFSDTGPGIPKEIEHRLFQSFVTGGKKDGTGLGLAITKRIAEEHGGTIAVRTSRSGAAFVLRLPQGAP